MTDQFDRATEREEMDREAALKLRKPEGPKPTGECLWCGEPVEEGRRWCPGVECHHWDGECKKLRCLSRGAGFHAKIISQMTKKALASPSG